MILILFLARVLFIFVLYLFLVGLVRAHRKGGERDRGGGSAHH
jgi:hypothetical protein